MYCEWLGNRFLITASFFEMLRARDGAGRRADDLGRRDEDRNHLQRKESVGRMKAL